MITTKNQKNHGMDKGTEFEGSFEAICKKKHKKHIAQGARKIPQSLRKYTFLEKPRINTWRIKENTHTLKYCKILLMQSIQEHLLTNLAPNKVTKKVFLDLFP